MALSSLLFGVSLLVAAGPGVVQPYPSGPPMDRHFNQICELMIPLHHDIAPIPDTGGYSIDTDLPRYGHTGFNYTAGKEYTGTIDNNNICRLIIFTWLTFSVILTLTLIPLPHVNMTLKVNKGTTDMLSVL